MELTNISTIRSLFERHGFSFTKSLGQNFLINPSVCPKIAESGGAVGICAIEIGTGVGVLTKELAARAKKVVAIEIDEGLKPILGETLSEYNNINIIFGDVMKLPLGEIISENFTPDDEIVVCANLPYYITSPVIMRLLEENLPIKAITVMVQKEAAERLCAKPGTRDCGAITIAVNYYSTASLLFRVNRGSFMPSPNVDSAVIRLDLRRDNPYRVANEKLFFRIVRSAFAQRRKQMINPLSSELGIAKLELSELMEKAGIKATSRAEELSMEEYTALYGVINTFLSGRQA